MTTYSMIAWDTGTQQNVIWTTTDNTATPLSTDTSPNYTGTLVEICILDEEGDQGLAVLTTTNWNTAITTGFYTCAANCTNAPDSREYAGEVTALNNGSIVQRVYFANVIYRQEYIRHKYGSTWTAWQDISDSIETTDWDTALTTGNYHSYAGLYTNAPTTDVFYVGVVKALRPAFDSAYFDITQTVETFDGTSYTVYRRNSYDNTGVLTWTAWQDITPLTATELQQSIDITVSTNQLVPMVFKGFNQDVIYVTGTDQVPSFVTTPDGNLYLTRGTNGNT